jgi:hypothetical protein
VPSRRPGGRVAIGESDQRAGHGGSRRPSRLRPPRPGSGRPRSGVRRWFCGEERLDPILVLADPQPPANEPRGNGVEDAAEHEPAAGGDAHVAPRRSKVRIPSAPPGGPWTAFDEGAGTLEVIGKGNKRRTISLSPAARGHFAGQNRNTSAIFPSAEGGPWVSVPPAFAKTVHRAAPRVPFRFRDLRHMYAITPASLSQEVALGLGAQAGEGRLRQVATEAGFKRFRRATETPFNMIFEVRS